MRRFIMTGAPGSGKTSILRALENLGYAVVEEAATDAIAALDYPVTATLREAVTRVTEGGLFDRRVFFVRLLGFCELTPVRRISYEDALAFERVHETEYLRLGFELVDIPPGPVHQRAALIDAHLRSWA
jgi:predicted ATPase